MSQRVTLPITMELCSDAIFGSGFSVPGGEDIAVCQDAQGFPYLKGSTVKGLLRESLLNLAAWTGTGEDDVIALLGQEGWPATAEERRVRFTVLTLDNPPQSTEDCYDTRTFTALENGIVKEGTLRTAACIRKGLVFSGQLECDAADTSLLRDGLSGIKWAGTLRNRGFGRLRFQAGEPVLLSEGEPLSPGQCVRYRLHSELPVIVTDLSRSTGNSFETQGYIPGGAIRGAVMGRLAAQDPAWFAAHKTELLSVRFLDAVPVVDAGTPLPSIRGFYEDKQESALDPNTATGAEVKEGHKRAKLGRFCALDGEQLCCWSAASDGTLRIKKGSPGKDTRLFQVRYLSAGQNFEGYFLSDDPALTPRIAKAMGETLWLGADRHAGYGKCSVSLDSVDRPAWAEAYGVQSQSEIGTVLYLLAVSPFTMLNEWGDPCGLEEGQLARKLGVGAVTVQNCAASLTKNGSYNRSWQCRAPSVWMYDRGSLFRLECDAPPALEALLQIQKDGLGIRRAEGFGQVLFLPADRLNRLKVKQSVKPARTAGLGQAARIRRSKYSWVEEQVNELRRFKLSKSQLGTIQTLCEEAAGRNGDTAALYTHLEHNLNDRGVEHGHRFQEIGRLIRATLETPLEKTLGIESAEDSKAARLDLLILLFNHSRKGEGDA